MKSNHEGSTWYDLKAHPAYTVDTIIIEWYREKVTMIDRSHMRISNNLKHCYIYTSMLLEFANKMRMIPLANYGFRLHFTDSAYSCGFRNSSV